MASPTRTLHQDRAEEGIFQVFSMRFGSLAPGCPFLGYVGVGSGVVRSRLLVLVCRVVGSNGIFLRIFGPSKRFWDQQSTMATQWPRNVRFSTAVGPRAHPQKPHFRPSFHPFWFPKRLTFGSGCDLRAVETAQIGLKTG